jgi:hypothetical protein
MLRFSDNIARSNARTIDVVQRVAPASLQLQAAIEQNGGILNITAENINPGAKRGRLLCDVTPINQGVLD